MTPADRRACLDVIRRELRWSAAYLARRLGYDESTIRRAFYREDSRPPPGVDDWLRQAADLFRRLPLKRHTRDQ